MPVLPWMLSVTHSLSARDMSEIAQQYFAKMSFASPDLGKLWANFASRIAQPGNPATYVHSPRRPS